MMPAYARRLAAPVLLSLTMIALIVWSQDYTSEARALPVPVAWATILLLALEALVQTSTRAGKLVARLFSGAADDGGGARTPEAGKTPALPRELAGIAGPLALVAAIVMFGILAAVPVYVFLSVRLTGAKSTARAAVTAVGVTAFVWGLFEWGMSYPLFRGVLFGDFQGF